MQHQPCGHLDHGVCATIRMFGRSRVETVEGGVDFLPVIKTSTACDGPFFDVVEESRPVFWNRGRPQQTVAEVAPEGIDDDFVDTAMLAAGLAGVGRIHTLVECRQRLVFGHARLTADALVFVAVLRRIGYGIDHEPVHTDEGVGGIENQQVPIGKQVLFDEHFALRIVRSIQSARVEVQKQLSMYRLSCQEYGLNSILKCNTGCL